jgi:hypothetical protein
MDDYFPTMLIVVLSVNLMLFFGQFAISDIRTQIGGDTQQLYNAQGSLICAMDSGGCVGEGFDLNNADPAGDLPSSEAIEAGDGSIFTDMFNSIKSFFTDTLGLKYITQMLSAPYAFLVAIGLPNAFAFGLGAVWYLFSLFVVIAFFWGR